MKITRKKTAACLTFAVMLALLLAAAAPADAARLKDIASFSGVRNNELVGYGLVAAASFLAGLVPLGQVVVQIAALFILHVIVLRRGLLWLPAGRRILARIAIKLFGAALAGLALLINVAIAPMVGASAFVLAAVGPALTALNAGAPRYLLGDARPPARLLAAMSSDEAPVPGLSLRPLAVT